MDGWVKDQRWWLAVCTLAVVGFLVFGALNQGEYVAAAVSALIGVGLYLLFRWRGDRAMRRHAPRR